MIVFRLLGQDFELSQEELDTQPDSVLTVAAACEREPGEAVNVRWAEADLHAFQVGWPPLALLLTLQLL